MTELSTLAEFLSSFKFAALMPETVASTKLHILDSLGAMVLGRQMGEGQAVEVLVSKLIQVGADGPTLMPAIITDSAAARSTECDDIHLESCTTPGSVIVPTAIALAKAGYLTDGKAFLAAVAAGYEALIRIGLYINGPAVLTRGIWPTYFAAPVGAAATAVRALNLNPRQALNALSIAIGLSSGTVVQPQGELTARWLTLGLAAQNGVIAVFAARDGFNGYENVLNEKSGLFHGLPAVPEKVSERLGQRWLIDITGMKPYPIARQALAAVAAFRDIIEGNGIEADSIDSIAIRVPAAVLDVINRPTPGANRLELISSVHYQIGLAAVSPADLFDLKKDRMVDTAAVRAIMAKTKVAMEPELDHYYSAVWPARVRVSARGQVYEREMLYPRGDHRNPLDWVEVTNKFRRTAARLLNEAEINEATETVQRMDQVGDLARLVGLMGNK